MRSRWTNCDVSSASACTPAQQTRHEAHHRACIGTLRLCGPRCRRYRNPGLQCRSHSGTAATAGLCRHLIKVCLLAGVTARVCTDNHISHILKVSQSLSLQANFQPKINSSRVEKWLPLQLDSLHRDSKASESWHSPLWDLLFNTYMIRLSWPASVWLSAFIQVHIHVLTKVFLTLSRRRQLMSSSNSTCRKPGKSGYGPQ